MIEVEYSNWENSNISHVSGSKVYDGSVINWLPMPPFDVVNFPANTTRTVYQNTINDWMDFLIASSKSGPVK
jgi:hypothetical protein